MASNVLNDAETSQGLVEIIPLDRSDLKPIKLTATALPLKGVSFSTEQRVKTTYYPGNPEGTQTVTGPVLPNTTMTGHWMDVDLGEGQARVLIRQIEYLCERAIPVEVRWGGRTISSTGEDDPAIVRRGLIKKFDPKYSRAQDAEWTIEFEWRGSGLQTKPPTFTQQEQKGFSEFQFTLEQTSASTSSWIDAAWELIGRGTGAMLTVSDAMDDVQTAIIDAINVIDGASSMIQDMAGLPSDVANRVKGVCDRVVQACVNGRAAFDALVGVLQSPGQDWRGGVFDPAVFAATAHQVRLALFPTDDPLDRLDVQTSQYDLLVQWDAAAEAAVITAAQISASQLPEVIAVVRPPAGSDLRDVAAKYYGSPDLWYIIADYNDLDTSEVPATPTGPSDDGAPPISVPRLVNAKPQSWGQL